jgi:hypothetical protein
MPTFRGGLMMDLGLQHIIDNGASLLAELKRR